MKTSYKIGRKEEEFSKILENLEADHTSEVWSRIIEDYRLDRLPTEEQSVIIRAYYRIMNQDSN